MRLNQLLVDAADVLEAEAAVVVVVVATVADRAVDMEAMAGTVVTADDTR
jgi:hypothetical protein